MLKDADLKDPRLPYDKLLQGRRLQLSFCVHPAVAGTIESGAKRMTMVDTVVKHSKRAGVVAVGEISIDNHGNQTLKAGHNCRLFLDALLTALQQDTVLKTMPLDLHVREAKDGSDPEEAASSQCISALWMARVPSGHHIYLHCFVGSQSVANMWTWNYPEMVFGSSSRRWRVWPRNASGVSEGPLPSSDDRDRCFQLEVQSCKSKSHHALVYIPDVPVFGSRERGDPSRGLGRCGQKLLELL